MNELGFFKYDGLNWRGKTVRKFNFGYLFILVTVVFFSTYEVVSKTIIGKVDPFQINFLRFSSAALCYFYSY